MNLKIALIYINTILLAFSIMTIAVLCGINTSMLSQSTTVSFLLLVCFTFKDFIESKYHKLLIVYVISLLISLTMVKDVHLSMISTFFSPFYTCCIIKEHEKKYFTPLFYFFIVIFVSNAVASFIERYIGFWIVPVDWRNDVLNSQMITDEMDILNFRAFAFFGHPLTNGNMMAFMSFIILYTSRIKIKYRLLLFSMGMASLFCFNTRGAILVCAVLLLPAIFNYLKNYPKYRVISIVSIIIIFYILYENFELFGGRLAHSDLKDSNTDVRLEAIDEFFSLSFSDLISGGYYMKNGENGIFMILAFYGLFIGSIKIFTEIFLSFKLIQNDNSIIHRLIIMLSLIAVASTNNNLATVNVVPFYILFITFVINNQPSLVNSLDNE